MEKAAVSANVARALGLVSAAALAGVATGTSTGATQPDTGPAISDGDNLSLLFNHEAGI